MNKESFHYSDVFEYKQKRMLRIEHKDTKLGLYQEIMRNKPDYKLYDETANILNETPEEVKKYKTLWSKECYFATWKHPRPPGISDPLLRDMCNNYFGLDCSFGFSNVKQLKSWFKDIEYIKHFIKNDFNVVYIKSEHIVHGLRQSIMKKQEGRKDLAYFHIEEFL